MRYTSHWNSANFFTSLLADGFRYEGEWLAGEITGHGIATYSNGDIYEGTFVNGRRQGQGTIKFANPINNNTQMTLIVLIPHHNIPFRATGALSIRRSMSNVFPQVK